MSTSNVCMICLGNQGELWDVCERNTCHNLKIHPKCFVKMREGAVGGATCHICDKPFVITVENGTCPPFVYIRSITNVVILILVLLSGAAMLSVIAALGVYTSRGNRELIGFWIFCGFGVAFVTFLCTIEATRKSFRIPQTLIYTSRKGQRYRVYT